MKNKKIFIENKPGGYRIWCDVCGQTETIPITGEGMPPEAFCAWCDSFAKRHENCVKKPEEQNEQAKSRSNGNISTGNEAIETRDS